MTAEEHNKTLGTLYFVYSGIHGLTLVVLLMLMMVVKFASPAGELLSTSWAVIGAVAFVVLFLVVGLLPLIVGYGFRKHASWLKPIAYLTAVVSLVNIPIGTALGIYTLKFFRSEAGTKLYGGAPRTADGELTDAMRDTQPLMNWANKLK